MSYGGAQAMFSWDNSFYTVTSNMSTVKTILWENFTGIPN
jgi:hypothetical protein